MCVVYRQTEVSMSETTIEQLQHILQLHSFYRNYPELAVNLMSMDELGLITKLNQ